jgi:peptidoglycan/LPS O-acetylase OafA/YrhL
MKPAHLNHFNLLRLILAALVIIGHAPEMLDGNASREPLMRLTGGAMTLGELAVDGFFLLSGYLILRSWLAQPAALAFLAKRVLRLVPGYLLAAAVCIAVVGPLAAGAGYFSSFWLGGTVFSILTLGEPITPPVFAGTPYPAVNGAMWSLRYEFLCYLGVLALGLAGLARRRVVLAVLAAALISLCTAARWDQFAAWNLLPGAAGHLWRLAAFFAVGMLYGLCCPRPRWSLPWGTLAALLLCAGMLHRASAELALLVCGSYLLFCGVFAPASWLAWAQRMPDASYGTYLYGWPAGKLLAWYWPGIGPGLLAAAALLLAYACGLASCYLIERPALALWRPAPGANQLGAAA